VPPVCEPVYFPSIAPSEIDAVPVAEPLHGSENVRVKERVVPATVPENVPSEAAEAVTEHPA